MIVVVSGNLRRYTSFEQEVQLEATSLRAALEALVARHPGLRPVLYDGDGKLRSVHRLFLNGELLDSGSGSDDRPLAPNDELGILTAIAGG